jgi:hypothetical protein
MVSMPNELGRFESRSVAALTTPVFLVVSGGVGTFFVVAVTAVLSPQLRGYGMLDGERK